MITRTTPHGAIINESGYNVLRVTVEVQITSQDAAEIVRHNLRERYLDPEEQDGRSYAEQRYDIELYDAIRDGLANSVVIAPTKLNVMGI